MPIPHISYEKGAVLCPWCLHHMPLEKLKLVKFWTKSWCKHEGSGIGNIGGKRLRMPDFLRSLTSVRREKKEAWIQRQNLAF